MNKKKISIIIPVYNGEKYIKKCMNSIINQSYENIEILVIDDGSVDNTKNIIKEYTDKDTRVKILTQKNSGVAVARNLGIANATGEYIAFIDGDDWVEENYIKNLYSVLDENDEISISLDIVDYYNENKINVWETRTKNINESEVEYFFKNRICIYVWGKLYKKSLFIENNIKFPIIKCGEDAIPNLKIFINGVKIKFVKNARYYYFQSENSLTRRIDEQIIYSRIKALDEMKKIIINNKENNKYIDLFKKFYIEALILPILSSIFKRSDNFSKLYIEAENLFDKDIYNIKNIMKIKELKLRKKTRIILIKLFPNGLFFIYKIFRRIKNG